MLDHDDELDLLFLYLVIKFGEAGPLLHDVLLLELPLVDQTHLLQQLPHKGSFVVPVPAVQPDDLLLVLFVAGEPVHSCRFAAMPRSHYDEALPLE